MHKFSFFCRFNPKPQGKPCKEGIMNYTTRSPRLQRLNCYESSWVFYKMRLKGVRQSDIARISGMANSTVSEVLNGKKSSLRVYAAVSSLLGYADIGSLLREVRRMTA